MAGEQIVVISSHYLFVTYLTVSWKQLHHKVEEISANSFKLFLGDPLVLTVNSTEIQVIYGGLTIQVCKQP